MARDQQITAQQVDAISRIAQAEFGRAKDKTDLYNGIRGVVDTVLNRAAAGTYGGDIEGVINAKNQFEPINKAGSWDNLPAAKAAVKAIVAERLAEVDDGAPTRPFTFFDNPQVVEDRAGKEASWATVDRSRLGLIDPGSQMVGPLGGYAHNYYDKPGFEAPRGFGVSLDDDARNTVNGWAQAYSGVGSGNLNDTPSELGAMSRQAPQSAGMSYTPNLPGPMPPSNPMEPGYNFSSMPFGLGLPGVDPMAGVNNLFSPTKNFADRQFSTDMKEGLAQKLGNLPFSGPNPGLKEIPAAPHVSTPPWSWPQAPSYDPLSSIGSIAPPAVSTTTAAPTTRDSLPGASPDWGTAGPGVQQGGYGDYTTGSNGTFQKAPPSVMAPAPAPKTTVAEPAPSYGYAVNAPMSFSTMKPAKREVVAAAAALADQKAAAEAASEMDRETQRAKALGALPQDIPTATPVAKPAVKAPPAAPIQKVKIAPVPVARPVAPQENRASREPESWNDPGAALRDQFGTPKDFMGSGVNSGDFAKGVAAVAAINKSDDANSYARQLYSNRPEIQGVAFDALNNEYAKATGAPQTPTLYDRLAASDVGQYFGMNPGIRDPSQPYGPDTRYSGGGQSYESPALAKQYGVDNAGYSPGYASYGGGGYFSGIGNAFGGFASSIGSLLGGVFGGTPPSNNGATGMGTSDLY